MLLLFGNTSDQKAGALSWKEYGLTALGFLNNEGFRKILDGGLG